MGKRTVFAMWHGHIPMAFAWRGEGAATIVSQSKDGELIAEVLRRFGFVLARGSSTRGGVRALVEMKRLMKNGHDAVLTVDGPKGPRHVVKPGIIFVAKQSDCTVVPVLMNCKHFKRFNSWDKMILPLPFSKVAITFAPALQLSADTDEDTIEREQLELEKYMLDCAKQYSSNII